MHMVMALTSLFFLLFKEMIKSPTILHLFLQTIDVLGGY